MYNSNLYHIKLKLVGTPEKLNLYHRLMRFIDMDWPFIVRKSALDRVVECPKCGGLEYRNPRISPADVKKAGFLMGLLKTKVMHYAHADRCEPGFVGSASGPVTPPNGVACTV